MNRQLHYSRNERETIQLSSVTQKEGLENTSIVGDVSTKNSDISSVIGEDGRWQRRILFINLMNISIAWNHFGIVFLAFPVDYWCARPDGSNISLHTWKHTFLPNVTSGSGVTYSQCEVFVANYTTFNGIYDFNETKTCTSWEYSTEYYSVVEQWDIVCEKSWLLSFSQTAYMFGFLAAVTFTGQMSDLFGRRPAILTNVFILFISSIATAFSPTFTTFLILRVFVGIGQAGMDIALFVLITEVFGSSCRAKYTMIQFLNYSFGFMVLPIIAWLISDWFYLQLLFSAASLVYACVFWTLPESPRWLLSKGHKKRALSVIKVAIETNGIVIEDLNQEIEKVYCFEMKKKESERTITFIELFKTPNLRRKTLYLFFIWITLAFAYYGLSLNVTELYGNKFLNFFLMTTTEIPIFIYCVLAADHYGRKKTLFVSLIIGGISCLGFLVIPEGYEIMQNILALSGILFVGSAFTIIYLYSAEIFPTVARNSGVGLCSMVARIGSATSPFMKELGHATNTSVPLVLFGVLCIISSLLLLRLPETKHQRIPETLDEAEISFENKNESTL